jgi:hypothetical protein
MSQESKDEAGRDVAADPADRPPGREPDDKPRRPHLPIGEADADSPSAIPIYPPVQGDGS